MKRWLIGTLVFANVVLAQQPTPILIDSVQPDLQWIFDPEVRVDLKEHGVTVLVLFHGHPDRHPLYKEAGGPPSADGYEWTDSAEIIVPWMMPVLQREGFRVVRYLNPHRSVVESGRTMGEVLSELQGWKDEGYDGVYLDGSGVGGSTPYEQRRLSRTFVEAVRNIWPKGEGTLLIHDSIVPGVGRRVTWQPHADLADYCRTGELPWIESNDEGKRYLEHRFGPPAPIPQTDDDPLWHAIYETAGCTMLYKPDPKGGPLKNPYHLPVEARCRQWKIAREHGHTDFISRSWFGPWKECMEGGNDGSQ